MFYWFLYGRCVWGWVGGGRGGGGGEGGSTAHTQYKENTTYSDCSSPSYQEFANAFVNESEKKKMKKWNFIANIYLISEI